MDAEEESGDSNELGLLLIDGFSIIRSNGQRHDRGAFLRAVKSNENRGRHLEQPQIQLVADAALFTCIVETTKNLDGTPNSSRFLSRLCIRKDGE